MHPASFGLLFAYQHHLPASRRMLMSESLLAVSAILFDMDGTLVDSTAGVVGAWESFRESYPGIDVNHILSSSHGVRTVDNLRKYCGIENPDLLEKEAQRFEEAIVASSTKNGRPGIVLLPGAAQILDKIAPYRHLPSPRWAICTSATRAYATSALKLAGVPQPDVLVVAEDVVHGKPHPEPYILGAKKCGIDPAKCISLTEAVEIIPTDSFFTGAVFEDAPSGVRSGRAAGCITIGLLTTHSREQMEEAQPDFLVQNLSSVSIRVNTSGGLDITISNALKPLSTCAQP